MTERLADGPDDKQAGLAYLALVSLMAGAAAGLLGAAFRLALLQADYLRNSVLEWSRASASLGLLVVVVLGAAAAALAAWLVRRFSPQATGSGIPHVEAVLNRELPQAPWSMIPVKFVGGLLAIGAGLALGREGPSVQMGATLSHYIGRMFRLSWTDCRALLAAGAGAGLATAFNAPIAGAVFVLEELFRRFDTRITIATFGASTAAIAVARVILGQAPDFEVAPLPYPGHAVVPLYLALGVVAGLVGAAYNWSIVAALAAAVRRPALPAEARAALVGIVVGCLGWYAPTLVGGGDPLTQAALKGEGTLAAVAALLAVRFVLGVGSYAAGTPGGLFAPLLVLGSQLGLLFAWAGESLLPALDFQPTAMAITGMAALFTAIVRAPVTGIILVIELTSGYTQLLPMLAACTTAMLVPTLLGNPPIYTSLRPTAGDK